MPIFVFKLLIIASLDLQYHWNNYDFNKKQASKFKKTLFYLTKNEKIILIRNTIDKTDFS